MKEIKNILFYDYIENGQKIQKSYIFYDNGEEIEGTRADGVAAIKEVLAAKGITTKEGLQKMINNEIIYTAADKSDFLIKYDKCSHLSFEETKEEEKEEQEEIVYEEEMDEELPFQIDNIEEQEDEEEKETIFVKIKNKLKEKNNLGLKIIAGTVAVAAGIWALTSCYCKRKSKVGEMKPVAPTIEETNNTIEPSNTIEPAAAYNNDMYSNYTFAELLNVTTNDFQKDSMIKASSTLTGFNGMFAKNYLETGHDIKAALSFDEMVALQQAYNNYSKDEIRSYFNGYETDAINMSNAYKSASLQLMGAYVIETKENPVDMSILIDNQEGKDFYNRYHSMYIAAKEATGKEQIELVNEFYKAVREDFPITEEVRTEGIAHSDDHNSLKDYQLSVAPMIAAAEMIFQNLDKDYTLDDSEIDFINDIGLCNYADDKFEKIETITLSSYEDKTNPSFEQFRNSIIAELVANEEYVIDDEHRELANLRRFQEVVNKDPLWLHRTTYTGEYGKPYTGDYGTTTKTWEETETTSETTTTTETSDMPEEEKEKVDKEIEKENEETQKTAQSDAEKERERQQEEADKEAAEVEKEVEEDNRKTEEEVEDINKTIDNGGTPNENNYENIDFDDDHSNSDGDLDNSVKNVTTDGTGADEELPDPNKYEKSYSAKETVVATTPAPTVTYTYEDISVEYDYEYVSYDEDGNPITEEKGYQYTK